MASPSSSAAAPTRCRERVDAVGPALEERGGRDAPGSSGGVLVDEVAAHVVGNARRPRRPASGPRAVRRCGCRNAAAPRSRPGYRASVINGTSSGCATRQPSTATESCERARRKPARPLVDAGAHGRAERPRRQLDGRLRTAAASSPPMRLSASSTMPQLQRPLRVHARCAATGTRRSPARAPGTAARPDRPTARAPRRAERCGSRGARSRRATRTRSPGSAPSTNTTRPSASRASALPPATIAVGTSSKSPPPSGPFNGFLVSETGSGRHGDPYSSSGPSIRAKGPAGRGEGHWSASGQSPKIETRVGLAEERTCDARGSSRWCWSSSS